MHKNFKEIYDQLQAIIDIVESKSLSGDNFQQQHGWNQVSVNKEDIRYIAEHFQKDLQDYDIKPEDLKSGYEGYLSEQATKLQSLASNLEGNFIDDASYLIYVVPNTLIAIQTIYLDIQKTFFTWEKVQDNRLIPKNLTRRLRGTSSRLDAMESAAGDLESKIELINQAHAAAESLPTDLEELKETQVQINKILKQAKSVLSEVQLTEITAQASLDKVTNCQSACEESTKKTQEYVEKCDEALQITTTQGLAAGFDQKAEQLNKSMKLWILGLLLALGTGAWLGFIRVESLSMALQKELTTGQAVLHTVMSIFSIGGPLWLAWISTQQITQRFKLAEDYAYKATIAKSYTGFSKHAGKFDDETAERLFNSTLDRFDEMPLRLVAEKDYNSPWHEFIDSESFKQAVRIFPELAQSAAKFAQNTKLRRKPKATLSPVESKEPVRDKEHEESV
ncbi:hypothetical protein L1D14_04760 [Vibrio tubiashii]|uniref:hypothetical protein n=1 Tax=Vibrio tubiashii TaxID=29498 RepID=UPI001EFDDD24|nr:hypothetical protein [Vibrio tubiashii]MCG9575545.1 hypothetical protein [Vibrio tubiashii]